MLRGSIDPAISDAYSADKSRSSGIAGPPSPAYSARSSAARNTASMSRWTVSGEPYSSRSKRSRMLRVSEIWKPDEFGGGTRTSKPLYLVDSGSCQCGVYAASSSREMIPPRARKPSKMRSPSGPW